MNNSFNHLYRFDEFTVDSFSRRLSHQEEPVQLPSRAFDLLLVLMQNSGRLMSKDELMDAVWRDATVEEANLAVNISLLRKALGEAPNQHRYIRTIPGRGYKFLAEVRQTAYETTEILLPEQLKATAIEGEFEEERHSYRESQPQIQSDAIGLPEPRPVRIAIAAAILFLTGVLLGFAALRQTPRSKVNHLPMKVVPFTSMQGNELEPAFSPDGRQIAFVCSGEDPLSGTNGIYVKLLNSENPLKITGKPGDYASPVWSPDGRYVAFTRRFEDEIGLYMVPALGGSERKLSSGNWAGECSAQLDWSPDGRFIAFTERRKEDAQEPHSIYLLSVETLEKRRLTFHETPGFQDRFPMFSPDGKQLAFVRISAAGTGIFLIPVGGGDTRQLLMEKRSILGLAWTPDGDLIFSSNRDGIRGLWRISSEGGEPEKQSVGEDATFPAVSRQGNLLAFEQSVEDANIWRVELDSAGRGKNRAERIISSTRWEGGVDISPDGSQIAYHSNRSGNSEIWVCNSDGSNNLQLTNFAGINLSSPQWSPDGRQIAFQVHANGQSDIYVIDKAGGEPRRLTDDSTNESVPTWSRDGRSLYFSSDRDGRDHLWKVAAEGGTASRVTDREAGFAFESADGKTLYYSARFRSGLWQSSIEGKGEIRRLEFPERGFWGYWALVEKGIYYIRSDVKEQFRIEFFDFASRRSRFVALLEKMPTPWTKGFAVSRDGRWLVYSQLDQSNSDIMVVEDFH